jgi:hypothetical protein
VFQGTSTYGGFTCHLTKAKRKSQTDREIHLPLPMNVPVLLADWVPVASREKRLYVGSGGLSDVEHSDK